MPAGGRSRIIGAVTLTRALPALLLAGYALAFGSAALGRGLLVFDDHPGQLYRLSHALTLGLAPWRWNPGWWGGYPELQYYPPGVFALGALLDRAALGSLGLEATYRALLWLAWCLPGASTYALLRRVLGDGWIPALAALVALTVSAETRSGVEEGLRWGLIAARIGWGLWPLLLLSLLPWLERAAPPLGAGVILAAIVLTHPAHAPGAVLAIMLAAMLGTGSRPYRLLGAMLVVGLGLGLAAVWLLPLLARLSLSVPLAWGEASLGDLGARFLRYPLLSLLASASLAALPWPRLARALRQPARFLGWLVPASLGLVLLDAVVAAPLGIRWLPADRVADTAVLALILGAAVGLHAWMVRMAAGRRLAGQAIAVVAVLALSRGEPEPALSLWPVARQWPTEVEVTRGLRLSELWGALREAPAGRILILRSAVPLEWRPEWWRPHSHVLALTPLRAGRDIIGGTFTHPGPVAAFYYTGTSRRQALDSLAEQRDGVTLFGRGLADMTAAEFETRLARLGVSTVVTLDGDEDRLGFLGTGQAFRALASMGPFRIRASRPAALPRPVGPGHLAIDTGPGPQGWRAVSMAYSPLWMASADGTALETREDEMGLLEVKAPPAGGTVHLVYGAGHAEAAGLGLSLGSLCVLAALIWRRRLRPTPSRAL
jgi:hypothetical protein